MRTKQFKAESKKLLDMMINSIYTHKEIFLHLLSRLSLQKIHYIPHAFPYNKRGFLLFPLLRE